MANLIDIRRRIRSVKNTQQITKAVKMVAASKLRRSQDRAIASRPYATTLEAILRSVASRVPPKEDGAPLHPLLATREEKNVVLLVVSGDKGLAGGFNTNVNRAVAAFLREAKGRGVANVRLVTLGKKANDFWRRRPVEILEARTGLAGLGAAARRRDRPVSGGAVRLGRGGRRVRRLERVPERHLAGREDEAPPSDRARERRGRARRRRTTSTSRRPRRSSGSSCRASSSSRCTA